VYEPILLTKAEAKVVTLLFEGMEADQISKVLGVFRKTINDHLRRVYRKAGVKSALGLVAMAYRNGGYLW
jgi:DNA-binding CsgD family transcriptional regulator